MAAAKNAAKIVFLSTLASVASATMSNCSSSAPSFYTSSHAALLLNGSLFSWASLQGQYTSLNKLMGLYASQGLSTIGYPCNQFGGQEPGDGIEILHCVNCVRPGNNFVPAFPLTVKIDVNGALADSTWVEMKKYCPGVSGAQNTDVGWNFETVIFDRTGKPIQRYSSDVDPIDIEPEIKLLLSQPV